MRTFGIVSRRAITVGIALCCTSTAARAQYAQTVFLEAARDPGRADEAKTARELALGSMQTIAGSAEDAVASAALLVTGSGIDAVFSAGRFGYARQELAQTPRQLPPFDASRALSPTSRTPVGYGAVAWRRHGWAVAGFADASARYSHAFDTAKAVMFTLALYPTLVEESASGHASVEQSVSRFGGSIAVGGPRASAGASVYLVHLRFAIDASTPVEIGSRSITDPVFRIRCCDNDRDSVTFDQWSTGVSLSGQVSPFAHLRLHGRWRHEPSFTATRLGARTGASETVSTSQRVEFDLPDVLAAGATATFGRTLVLGEIARHMYAGAYAPLGNMSDPSYRCAQFKVTYADFCSGWNFPYHDTRSTTVLKFGVEQVVLAGGGRVSLRAGIAREPGYTLARDANDPSTRRGLDYPSPAVATPFEPPREDMTWLSTGIAYGWNGAEIGFGVGTASHQTRWLIDVRIFR